MKAEKIESERLFLRGYEESDIVAWQKWDTDPEVQKYLPGPMNTPVTNEDQLVYLNGCLTEETAVYWSIVWKESEEVIGTISLTDIDIDQRVAELNIIIGEKEYWGKGIATEAIRLVNGYAKTKLGLQKIVAEVDAANTAIAKTLLAMGFVKKNVSSEARIGYYLECN